MSLLTIMAALAATHKKLTYTVTGGTINGGGTGSSDYAGVRFNQDGTIDSHIGLTYSQISSATDWVIPNAHGLGNHYIRFTSLTGDTLTGNTGAFSGGEDVWGELITVGECWVEDSNPTAAGALSSTFTVEIATDSGGTNVVASGSFTLTADYET